MEIARTGDRACRIKGKAATVLMESETPEGADVATSSRAQPGLPPCSRLGEGRRLAGPGEFEVRGVPVVGVQTIAEGACNTVFVAWVDGIAVCHLGELTRPLTPVEAAAVDRVDVLILPPGAHSAETIAALEPRMVIPLVDDDAQREQVARQLGVGPAEPQPRVVVNAETLPEARSVVFLDAPRAARRKAA